MPDLAIGRLPATTVAQAETMVAKILAWEDSGQGLDGAAALVADNPDAAGDFEAEGADIETLLPAGPSDHRDLPGSSWGAATSPEPRSSTPSTRACPS